MNKNEIIDAVVACWDRDGVVSGGVYVDRFVALAKRLPAYRDAEVAEVAPVAPAADETSHPAPEPVVEAPVEPAVVVEPVVVEAAVVEPVVAEPVVE
jgi:hypothetical protein